MPDSGLRSFSLDGKTALVTGASRGIGAAIANALADAGARVVGVARSASASGELSTQVRYVRIDLSDTGEMEPALKELLSASAPLHILVNAAGVSNPAGQVSDPITDFRRTIDVNLTAAFTVVTIALPFIADGGSIINVSSINSSLGFPGNPGYVASKGGLSALTRALAVDLGSRGIRVNCLVPGYFPTNMTAASFEDEARRDERSKRTALSRWGKLDEIGGPAVFLASDASSYMTGSALTVDGGWSVKGL